MLYEKVGQNYRIEETGFYWRKQSRRSLVCIMKFVKGTKLRPEGYIYGPITEPEVPFCALPKGYSFNMYNEGSFRTLGVYKDSSTALRISVPREEGIQQEEKLARLAEKLIETLETGQ